VYIGVIPALRKIGDELPVTSMARIRETAQGDPRADPHDEQRDNGRDSGNPSGPVGSFADQAYGYLEDD
jgi:hypothetical protein